MNSNNVLTVAGGVSVGDSITWYGKDYYSFYKCMPALNSNSFIQSFEPVTNVFSINNQIHIRSNAIDIFNDTNVTGILTATEFRSPSDMSIKTNIVKSDCLDDLGKLLKINIFDFSFKSNPESKNKGVLAQEVEGIIPEAVSTKSGFIPNICKHLTLNSVNSFIMTEIDFNIDTNSELRLIYGDKYYDVRIENIQEIHKENKKIIIFSPQIPLISGETSILLYGTNTNYKTVNYDYLFSMCINAIKAIYRLV
jgi:hypothetical protein